MTRHDRNRMRISELRAALRSGQIEAVREALKEHFAPQATLKLGYPFGELTGPQALWDQVYAQLYVAFPDLERSDFIAMAGPCWNDLARGDWVGIGGHFIGTFSKPWLGIPPTGGPVQMRYHEYLRIVDDHIIEMEALWDIPAVMAQAGIWPLSSQRGADWMSPGPANGCGVIAKPFDIGRAQASVQTVWDMLHDLQHGTCTTPERGLPGYWHENALWYGPRGLGTARGHKGIAERIFSQFRAGLSENTRHLDQGVFFGDGDLVAFTGWPSGTALHSGPGFMGLNPTNRRFDRRSLDFWRVEHGLIRECWVMLDVLDILRQLGADLFEQDQEIDPSRLCEIAS